MAVRVRKDHTVLLAGWVVTGPFASQWVNPTWEILGYRINAESSRIVEQLSDTMAKLGPVPDSLFDFSDSSVAVQMAVPLPWVPLRSFGLFALSVVFAAFAGFAGGMAGWAFIFFQVFAGECAGACEDGAVSEAVKGPRRRLQRIRSQISSASVHVPRIC